MGGGEAKIAAQPTEYFDYILKVNLDAIATVRVQGMVVLMLLVKIAELIDNRAAAPTRRHSHR